ncbi:methyltransferase family protein [Methanosarcina sp. UBA5]|uniref:methyltransferase family protein n=1 Tax=Methanosarcina sp. UBA5 TaxID=1915593 RepID=UPI0025CC55DC|nr:isoprenylcysteine carboxylmethyltransferase family protein [Methanosarcina sp. UBA5]
MEEAKEERIIMAIQWGLWFLFPLSAFVEQARYTFLKPVGYLLLIFAFILFIMANKEHGSTNKLKLNASPRPNNSAKLVTSGVYAYIRHPIYSSFIQMSFGIAFLIGTSASIAVAVISLVFYYLKSRYEEKLLIQKYPDYNLYKERTGRFIPETFKLRKHI